jgi:hypothetical protein
VHGLRQLAAATVMDGGWRLVPSLSSPDDAARVRAGLYATRSYPTRGAEVWVAEFGGHERGWWSDVLSRAIVGVVASLERSLEALEHPWNIEGAVDRSQPDGRVEDLAAAVALVEETVGMIEPAVRELLDLWKERWDLLPAIHELEDRQALLEDEDHAFDPTVSPESSHRRIWRWQPEQLRQHVHGWGEVVDEIARQKAHLAEISRRSTELSGPLSLAWPLRDRHFVLGHLRREVRINTAPDPDRPGQWKVERHFNVRDQARGGAPATLRAVVLRWTQDAATKAWKLEQHPDDAGLEHEAHWTLTGGDATVEGAGETIAIDDREPITYHARAHLSDHVLNAEPARLDVIVYENTLTHQATTRIAARDDAAGQSIFLQRTHRAELRRTTAAITDLTDGGSVEADGDDDREEAVIVGDDRNGGFVYRGPTANGEEILTQAGVLCSEHGERAFEINPVDDPAPLLDHDQRALDAEWDRLNETDGWLPTSLFDGETYSPHQRPYNLAGLGAPVIERLIAGITRDAAIPGTDAHKALARRPLQVSQIEEHLDAMARNMAPLLDLETLQAEATNDPFWSPWGWRAVQFVEAAYNAHRDQIRGRGGAGALRDVGIYWGELWSYSRDGDPDGRPFDSTVADKVWFVIAMGVKGRYLSCDIIHDRLVHFANEVDEQGRRLWRPIQRRKWQFDRHGDRMHANLRCRHGNGVEATWDSANEVLEGEISLFRGLFRVEAGWSRATGDLSFQLQIPNPLSMLPGMGNLGNQIDPLIELNTKEHRVAIRLPHLDGFDVASHIRFATPIEGQTRYYGHLSVSYNWEHEAFGVYGRLGIVGANRAVLFEGTVDTEGVELRAHARIVGEGDSPIDATELERFTVEAQASVRYAFDDQSTTVHTEIAVADGVVRSTTDARIDPDRITLSSDLTCNLQPLLSRLDAPPELSAQLGGRLAYDSETGMNLSSQVTLGFTRDLDSPKILRGRLNVQLEGGFVVGDNLSPDARLGSTDYLGVYGELSARYTFRRELRGVGQLYVAGAVGNRPQPGSYPLNDINAELRVGAEGGVLGDFSLGYRASRLFGDTDHTGFFQWELGSAIERLLEGVPGLRVKEEGELEFGGD